MAEEFQQRVRPLVERVLEPGEELAGICAATQVGIFKGSLLALGVTDRRLVLQRLDRKIAADGEPVSITAAEIASAGAEGLSGGWPNLAAAVADRAGVTLKLRTTDGEKRKLMMMRGGAGTLGKLGGGEAQQEGVEALARWFEAIEPG